MATLASANSLAGALAKLTPSDGLHVWLDAKLGLVVGAYPKARSSFDFANEAFVAIPSNAAEPKKTVNLLGQAKRVSQLYEIETADTIYTVGSATQALIEGLNLIEANVPGTLEKLSHQKKRSKRPVAQNRSDLYDNPGSEKYSARLQHGYFVATNNKAAEAIGILKDALLLAGPWAKQFTLRKR